MSFFCRTFAAENKNQSNIQTMDTEGKRAFNVEFWRFLWSSILIALSACLGNVVDSIIVGNLIGEDGVSAINLTKPVTQFMFTVSMLLSTGAGMLVGMQVVLPASGRALWHFAPPGFCAALHGEASSRIGRR